MFVCLVVYTKALKPQLPVCPLQVYELTLHHTQHGDHNVVTASLELLQQMFRTPPPELLHALTTPGALPHHTVFRQEAVDGRARSGSIVELIGKDLRPQSWPLTLDRPASSPAVFYDQAHC